MKYSDKGNITMSSGVNAIKANLKGKIDVYNSLINNEKFIDDINSCAEIIAFCFNSGNKVLIGGNGGSMCDASHFSEEFTGKFRNDRIALPVIALNDPMHISCVANDYGYDHVFSRYIEAHGKKGDVFIALTTSGNSKNIIEAVRTAKCKGLIVVSLLGKDGGLLRGISDKEIIINQSTSDRIQEIHIFILHTLIELVERSIFPELY